LAEFPKFKYHPDPIGTEAFKKADALRVCQCCGKKTEYVYEAPSFRRKMWSVFARTA